MLTPTSPDQKNPATTLGPEEATSSVKSEDLAARADQRSPGTPIIGTERLRLVPIGERDAPDIQQHFPHWEIVKHMNVTTPWPYPEHGGAYFCKKALQKMELAQEWTWAIRLKTHPDETIGVITLRDHGNPTHRGFWLAIPWQRQGLMTEACTAANTFWFDVLRKPTLLVSKAVDNIASNRVSEKEGMRRAGDMVNELVSGPATMNLWELTAEEWTARRSQVLPQSGKSLSKKTM